MPSFAAHFAHAGLDLLPPAENRIDLASARLGRAFERLESALERRTRPVAVDTDLAEQSAQLERSLAILKEENEKLNLLLRESAGKYEQLREVAVTVAAGLDSSIGRVEEILS